jgi:adenylosuccinate lyase
VASDVIDSLLFRDLFSSEAMRAVFAEQSLVQHWLDVEAALARAQAELGLIPTAVAEEITAKARVEHFDLQELGREIFATMHPIVPLLGALADLCEGEAGEYVHWGATTQDIMDTGLVLQLREALTILERQLDEVAKATASLADRYRATPMPGRTHGQHAVPITFGLKSAVWLAEVDRHQDRLHQLRPRLLVGQLAGAAGTLASLGTTGLDVQRLLMSALGLDVPLVGWHTARDGLGELGAFLALIAGTAGKIANEVIALQKTEVLELQEPWHDGKVGSSTMPHKRNPMLCESIVGMSKIARGTAAVLLDLTVQEHERDMRAWHAEWKVVPEICLVTSGALELLIVVLQGLEVDPDRMAHNLQATHGLILSERVMMELAPMIGRARAHERIYDLSMRAFAQGIPLPDVLKQDPELSKLLPAKRLAALFEPAEYIGLSTTFVDRVLISRARPDLGPARSHATANSEERGGLASARVGQLHHTGLQVSSLERSLIYYRDLIGLELVSQRDVSEEYVGRLVGSPGVSIAVAYLRVPHQDHLIELLEYRGASGVPVDANTANPGTAHVCFEVDDLGSLYARLLAAGHTSVSEPLRPTSGPNLGRLAVYAVDPDGIRVELVESGRRRKQG